MTEHAKEDRAHAILSANGATIWLNCPAAARAQENFPDTKSDFSREGTMAHAYSEANLRWFAERVDRSVYDHLVAKVTAEAKAATFADGTPFWNQAFHDHCMEYVNRCIRAIAVAREETPDALVLLEQRLDYSDYAPEGFGTGDLVIITEKRLTVRDLKFGKGVAVDAEDNKQLKMYGLGAVAMFHMLYGFEEVVVEIDQPRKGGVSTSEPMSVTDLIAWGETVVKPAAKIAWEGLGPAIAGSHCAWCKARFTCRARAEAGLAVRGQDPQHLTDSEIIALFPKLPGIAKWATELAAWIQDQAVKGTREWPGYMLAHGRSNRVVKDQAGLVKALAEAGFDEFLLFETSEPQLIGLGELESLVGKKKFEQLSKPFIEKPEGAPKLVPVGTKDAKPYVRPGATSADEDFADT